MEEASGINNSLNKNISVSLPTELNGVHIHFVGIKGTGMAALVEIMYKRGVCITGSDVSERFYTDAILEKLGLQAKPFSEKNITDDIQFVIYSSAYSPLTNPDLIEAKRRKLPMMLYTEALGAVSASAYSCGVCGVHGKTTTTGMVGTLLKAVELPSQVLAGSIIASFGNTCTMTSKRLRKNKTNYFVAETCEYQRHFMSFHPNKIILTSVESDHQDYYPTYADIRKAFVDYVCLLPSKGQLIYCADDDGAIEVAGLAKQLRPDIQLVPYGVNAWGDYKLSFGIVEKGIHHFTVDALGECAICIPGNHNVRNAVAAIALCRELLKTDGKNISLYADKIKEGLLKFTGGKRRSEVVGKAKTVQKQEVIVIDDYGHHPTAIKSTLAGFREFYKGHKIIVDFMSHTYSRTAALLEEFSSCFDSADCVIINKIYASAREVQGEIKVSGKILAEKTLKKHSNVFYCEEFEQASDKIMELLSLPSGNEYPDGYLLVTMGAGDNWKVGQMVLQKLKNKDF